MIISIISGKGGAGKTFLSTHLATFINKQLNNEIKVIYADCDAEEPNGHIFLKPNFKQKENVVAQYPKINESLCIHCGKCEQICRFEAIKDIKTQVIVIPSLCHTCGGCFLICPKNAIEAKEEKIGVISEGKACGFEVIEAKAEVEKNMAPTVIRKLKDRLYKKDCWYILDSPPGTACSAVATIYNSNVAILVAEATPFGIHDIKLVINMVKEYNIPAALVINKLQENTDAIQTLQKEEIPIIASIPFDIQISKELSRGNLILNNDTLNRELSKIVNFIRENYEKQTNSNN